MERARGAVWALQACAHQTRIHFSWTAVQPLYPWPRRHACSVERQAAHAAQNSPFSCRRREWLITGVSQLASTCVIFIIVYLSDVICERFRRCRISTCNTPFACPTADQTHVVAAINHFYYIQSFASWFRINFFLRVLSFLGWFNQFVCSLRGGAFTSNEQQHVNDFIVIACVCVSGRDAMKSLRQAFMSRRMALSMTVGLSGISLFHSTARLNAHVWLPFDEVYRKSHRVRMAAGLFGQTRMQSYGFVSLIAFRRLRIINHYVWRVRMPVEAVIGLRAVHQC